jgi:hypothetical protein
VLDTIIETVSRLAPIVFPLVILSQLLIKVLGMLVKLVFRPQIKLYPAGMIELGVDHLGPTVTLFGTMQALRRDFFITKIEVEVKPTATRTRHTFEWRALKPYVFGLHAEETVQYELISAFSLKPAAPFKYNIVFVDDSFVNQATPEARILIEAWAAFNRETVGNATSEKTNTRRAQLEAFYRQPDVQAIAQTWRDRLYWAAGFYDLTVTIYGDSYKARYAYRFELAAEQVETLQSNIKRVIFGLCGEPVAYSREFAEYLPPAR